MLDQFKTKRQISPYRFTVDLFGKHVYIENTSGEHLILDRDDITRALNNTDLDPHRRKMYEQARDVLRAAQK
jgi:hypothetical protein